MIKCDICSKSKKVNIYVNEVFKEEMNFENINFKKESCSEDIAYNLLKLIGRLSIDIKLKYNAKEEDTILIIDDIYSYNLLKPNGIIINKLTKSMKKNIKNNELKLLLGSTLYEISSIQNIQIELKNEKNIGEEDNMFDNNKIEEKDFNIDIDMDDEYSFSFEDDEDLSSEDTELSINLNGDLNYSKENLKISSFDIDNEDEFEIVLDEDEEITNEEIVSEKITTEGDAVDIDVQEELDSNTDIILDETSNSDLDDKIKIVDETKSMESTTKVDVNKNVETSDEFEYLENYLNERIDVLNKELESMEKEYESLNVDVKNLSISEEVLIENFKKSMEMRLTLKVVQKSLTIYNNLKTQLQKDLSEL